MIVKSLSRKSRSFCQLLKYMTGHGHGKAGEILHNLRHARPSLLDVRREFEANARFLPRGKSGVILYHEILSLGRGDLERITVPMLKDLAYQYLALRAPEALAYGQVHLSTGTAHVHLMISGNLIGSERKLTLKKAAFERVKRDLERYQLEKYPSLTVSQVFEKDGLGRARTVRKTWQEAEWEKRLAGEGRDQPNRKEELHQEVTRILTASRSREEFLENLAQKGLRLYLRGEGHGVEEIRTGLKHRLKTLGLQETYREAEKRWEAVPERLASLNQLELGRLEGFWKQLGYREDISIVLEAGEGGPRLEKLKELLARKREMERDRIQEVDLDLGWDRDPP